MMDANKLELLSRSQLSNRLHISLRTLTTYEKELIAKGICSNTDIFKARTGRVLYSPKAVQSIIEMAEAKRRRSMNNIKIWTKRVDATQEMR